MHKKAVLALKTAQPNFLGCEGMWLKNNNSFYFWIHMSFKCHVKFIKDTDPIVG